MSSDSFKNLTNKHLTIYKHLALKNLHENYNQTLFLQTIFEGLLKHWKKKSTTKKIKAKDVQIFGKARKRKSINS